MSKRIGVFAIVLVTIAAGCSEAGTRDGGSVTVPPVTSTEPTDLGSASVEASCAEYAGLQGEVSESYVGSAEHLADVERLLAVAPDSVSAELVIFRDYLSTGAIDSAADPESNLTENWPAEVQAAIGNVQTFGEENC